MAYQSINPNDGKLLKSFEHLTPAQLEKSLAGAQQGYQTWKHRTYAERAVVLNKAAALLHEHVDDFAKLETLEMGKRINEARGEVKFSGDILAYYAQHAESFLAPLKLHPRLGEAHMESSPMKKSVMELGGSDAFIVLDDADLDKTLPWAVWGRMYNAGQTCCAAKRFIVMESVADRFLAKFKTALEALEPGDPMVEATTLGPVSTEAALAQLLAQVDAAVKGGATLLMGGKRIDRPGWFMEPTILTDIAPGNPAFRDEFFGPVVSFFRVKTEEEAIALANDSDFGLAGSVWTKDEARGKRVASQIDTGMMFVNNIDWADADLPFGGIKNSGYGRELGSMGIQEFVNKKLVRSGAIAAPV